MQVTRQSRINYRIHFIIFVVLFLFVIGMLAWLSNTYNVRSDWTANKRNSLSEQTVELLNNIQGPVTIRSYQDNGPLIKQAVDELLQRYQAHKSDLKYRLLNPDLDIELAKADNITLYGQTVIDYADKQEIIDDLNENNLSNALLRLSRDIKPLLMFTQGHGERDPNSQANTGYGLLKQKLSETGFNVQSINLLNNEIPEDISVLIIAAPSHAFHAGEVERLQSFLDNGGHLFWLQDPGNLQGLENIAETIGIEFIKGVIVDDNVTLRNTLRIQHPAVVPIIEYYPHAITEDMRYNTLFPIASGIQHQPRENWQAFPLLKTMDSSWSETDGFALAVEYNEDKGDQAGPHSLAIALQRQLEQNKQRIVVIGDSDFIANTYLGTGANLLLVMNIFNWLSESDELINISTPSNTDLQLNVDDTAIMVIGLGFLLVLPLGLVASGFFIWFKRRNR